MRNPSKKTELELQFEIAQGNEKAVAELLNIHKGKLFYAAYILLKDRYVAEDIFQDACIKAIRSIRNGNYIEEGKFLPWAVRIVRNLAIDYIRVSKRMPQITSNEGKDIFNIIPAELKNKETQIMQGQSHAKVKELLALLPIEQREVIILRLFSNLSFKQIAELTQVSINTTLGRMRYGLIALRKMVDKYQLVL